jgi:hypothetical protein
MFTSNLHLILGGNIRRNLPVILLTLTSGLSFAASAVGAGPGGGSGNPVPVVGVGGLSVTLQVSNANCLHVRNGSLMPGAQVEAYVCDGDAAETFRMNYDGTITNLAGFCLDVFGGNVNLGVLDFTNCNGTPAQQWQQKGPQIVGLAGRCLGEIGGGLLSGALAQLLPCDSTPAQQWSIINAPTILQSVDTKCLDIINSNTAPGARLQIYECNRGINAQIFKFTAAGEIRNHVGLCLDALGGATPNGQVEMAVCNGNLNQKWLRTGREIRSYLVDSAPAFIPYCLGTVTIADARVTPLQSGMNHTAVGLVRCNGTTSQQWIMADLFVSGPATLLIVTSDAFAGTFNDFLLHKQAMGLSAKLLTMSQVRAAYQDPSQNQIGQYLDPDDALALKRAIEDFYRNFGTKYVLLAGDATQVPVRFRKVLNGDGKTNFFSATDLYYENLYSGHMPFSGFHLGFDDWDSNHDGFYNEQSWNDPLPNPDNVDGFPDIAVGRIPAYDTASLTAALNKIIRYERQTQFPPANKFAWVADECYPGASDMLSSLSNKFGLGGSFYAEEFGNYRTDPDPNPPYFHRNSCNVNPAAGNGYEIDTYGWNHFQAAVQNDEFEWITYVGHGGPSGWGGGDIPLYWTSSQLNQLSNQYLPIVSALACQTAEWEAIGTRPGESNGSFPFSYRPSSYDPDGSYYSSANIGAQWLFNPIGGAVAYIGENLVMEDYPDFMTDMFRQRSHGYARLGEIWRMAQQEYFDDNFVKPGNDNHFSAPRIYLGIVNLLGDPSMRTK